MFPRWLSWLVLLMVAYIIIQGNRKVHPDLPTAAAPVVAEAQAPQTVAETPGKPIVPEMSPALKNATDIERWKRAINPDYAERIQCELKAAPGSKPALLWKVTEDETGSGSAARCGERVKFTLTAWNAQGGVAYTGDIELLLGAREVAAGLDAALVGIRNGATRTVILAPGALGRDKKATVAPKPLLAALPANRVAVVTATRIE